MTITSEKIRQHMAVIEKQMAAYQGAYQLCEQLLRECREDRDDLTVNEFAEMVAGPGARATIEEEGAEEAGP